MWAALVKCGVWAGPVSLATFSDIICGESLGRQSHEQVIGKRAGMVEWATGNVAFANGSGDFSGRDSESFQLTTWLPSQITYNKKRRQNLSQKIKEGPGGRQIWDAQGQG